MRKRLLSIFYIVFSAFYLVDYPALAGDHNYPYYLYSKGDFSGAINALKSSDSKLIDYQLLFNSYIGLYIKNPNNMTKIEAFKAAARYRKLEDIDDASDPGPMYVVFGEDDLAMTWYKELHARQHSDNCNSPGKLSLRERTICAKMKYSDSAIDIINDPGWKALALHEKLEKLLNAERSAVSAK